jgi:hypothetical protein
MPRGDVESSVQTTTPAIALSLTSLPLTPVSTPENPTSTPLVTPVSSPESDNIVLIPQDPSKTVEVIEKAPVVAPAIDTMKKEEAKKIASIVKPVPIEKSPDPILPPSPS